MTTKKKATAGKVAVKKLKLKKETLRDLEMKGRNIKAGLVATACSDTLPQSGHGSLHKGLPSCHLCVRDQRLYTTLRAAAGARREMPITKESDKATVKSF